MTPASRRGHDQRSVTVWRAVIALMLVAIGCSGSDDASRTGITVPPIVTVEPTIEPPTSDRPPCGEYTPNDDLPLRRCDRGELVKSVQAELANVLGIELAADGYFGDQTQSAVLRYQTDNDLEPDGLVGAATWNALFGSNVASDGSTRGIAEDWFRRPAAEAIAALEQQGFVVIDYQVCSGTVGNGEVRQVASGDGTIYVDETGITAEGAQLPIGSVVEVKIGSGAPC